MKGPRSSGNGTVELPFGANRLRKTETGVIVVLGRAYNDGMNLDENPLLRVTDLGLYCDPGGFYIDPWRGSTAPWSLTLMPTTFAGDAATT